MGNITTLIKLNSIDFQADDNLPDPNKQLISFAYTECKKVKPDFFEYLMSEIENDESPLCDFISKYKMPFPLSE